MPSKQKSYQAPNFQAILYPESMDLRVALDWFQHCGMQVAVSPLHDSDTYDLHDVEDWLLRHSDGKGGFTGTCPKLGDPKKPHWHVLFHKPKGNTSNVALLDVLSGLKLTDGPGKGKTAITYLARVPDLLVATRYLAHLDSKNKAAYDAGEIIYLNGYDESLIDGVDKNERSRAALTRALDAVEDFDVTNFYELVRYARKVEDADLFDVCSSRSAFLSLCIDGRNRLLYGKREKGQTASDLGQAERSQTSLFVA